jgi:sigma-E factor negative regulatory protein RseA
MSEEISAFVDGELTTDSAGHCLQRIKQNDDLLRKWDDYHLIGDALRGEIRPALGASFAQKLAAEPTVLAPRAMQVSSHSRWMTALSAAAGVATVAVAAWVALPQTGQEQAAASVAALKPGSAASQVAASGPMSATAGVAAKPLRTDIPVAVGVEDYLLAHQRFSPASSMQGVAPYARTVSAERRGDTR